MKKIFALICALALVVSLAACAPKETAPEDSNPIEDMSLTEILEASVKDVENIPMSETTELTEENFEFYAFIPYAEGYEGLAADAMIGSIAHSVVLIRVPAEADAEAVADEIEQNANPRKWICVGAEKTIVRQYGNTILLAMSGGETVNAILQNFDALNNVETPAEDLVIPELEEGENTGNGLIELPAGNEIEEPAEPSEETEEPEKPETPEVIEEKPAEKPSVEQPAEKPAPEKPADKPAEKPAEKPEEVPVEPEKPETSGTDLGALMGAIGNGVADLPMLWDTELTADNFESYAFIAMEDGYRGLASEAAISSVAHSQVLVEVPEGVDAAAVAESMKDNANPRKWICVEAESVQVAVKGQLILFVMSSQDKADALIANFNAY